MKLYGSKMSPFVRHALIVIEEIGFGDKVAFVAAEGSPLDAPGLRVKNPLKKIPFLELEDGRIVYDSRVLIEHLVGLAPAQTLLPSDPGARLDALTRQALALGAADCAVGVSYERRLRPEEKRWPDWIAIQLGKVDAALDAMAPASDRFDLGDSAAAALLAYLDARYSDRPWRAGRDALAAWFEAASERPSVAAIR